MMYQGVHKNILGDFMSKIKVNRSQKVNKGYDIAYKRSLNIAFSVFSVWFFSQDH